MSAEREGLTREARLWLSQMAKRYADEGQMTNGPRTLAVKDYDFKRGCAWVERLLALLDSEPEPDARYVVVATVVLDEDGFIADFDHEAFPEALRAPEGDMVSVDVYARVGPVPRVEPVAWGVVEREASGRIVRMALNELWPSRAAFIESGRTYNVRPGYTYTVEPVGASPVASAPEEEREAGSRWEDFDPEVGPDGEPWPTDRAEDWAEFLSDQSAGGYRDVRLPRQVISDLVTTLLRATPTEEQERRAPESEEGGDD